VLGLELEWVSVLESGLGSREANIKKKTREGHEEARFFVTGGQ